MNGNNSVKVYTSLPPAIKKVDPYFYLNFHLNYVKFTTKSIISFENVAARVIWWGEEGGGAIFHPRIVNLAGHKQMVQTTARYKVCVPLNHFSTYLSDMDKLYIDFFDENKQIVIGRCFIENLKQLGYNKSLRSLSNIYNENNVKIGEVLTIMSLENGSINSENISDKELNDFKNVKIDKNNKEKLNLINSSTNIISKLRDSMEKIDKSHNFIDELIEKGKKLRETISINVKNDEINDDIARKTFPDLENQPIIVNDDEWFKKMFIEQSSNNFSANDISKINTESILKSSPNFQRRHFMGDKCTLNNDTEALKLLTDKDSYYSDSNLDLYQNNYLTRSEEVIAHLDKEFSSDDDPCKRDSIIEELFYKQNVVNNDKDTEEISKINQKRLICNSNAKFTSQKSDYEIYKSLSKDPGLGGLDDNNDDVDDDDNEGGQIINEPVDSNWYQNISSLKVCLDTLWLNPHGMSPSKTVRSRSQSSNGSSDRERCRRSHDSGSSFNNSSLSLTASRPPLSKLFQWNPSSKYFIEYQFPRLVEEESYGDKENCNIPRCPVRVPVRAGDNNNNNGVKIFELNHSSEFPVTFNNVNVAKWWRSHVRFRLVCQDHNNKETIIAVSVLPLRNVVSTNNFYRLIPMRLSRTKINKARVVIGSLAIRTTFVATKMDSVDHDHSRREKLHPTFIRNAPREDNHVPLSLSLNKRSRARRLLHISPQKSVPLRHTTTFSTIKMHPINLMSLISVSRVRYVSTKMISGDYKSGMKSCNLYFIGRLLWAPDQKIKSRILWGSSKISDGDSSLDLENFKLSEKVPLILTYDLTEKLRNNFAILEVWDKSMDNTKDSLYGIVKIPMNIISLSFTNDHIRTTVLNNVYPLMCCDDWVNIEDALTGKSKGQIHVTLAIGSHQQIDNLELSKENTVDGHWNRNYMASSVCGNDLVEHIIEVDLESLRCVELSLLPESSSKESFCYVQYYFPQQEIITENNCKSWKSTVFRSVSHPTQRNVDISDINVHKFRLPIDSSLKTFLNSHFEGLGKKHILFELYSKQYNPFPSTRSIAKGRLQISSLFQLINQHSVTVDSVSNTVTQQQISIRLVCEEDSENVSSVGTLNICLSYKTKLLEKTMKNFNSPNVMSPCDQPIVKVEVLAATGLQKAAEALLRIHPELEYASVTGVNSHVKYWVTDESNKKSRINVNSKGFQKFKVLRTKTVRRSFTPKYEDVNEILLGAVIDDDNDSNSLYRSLAEKILAGIYQLNVEVYHEVPTSSYCDFEDSSSMSAVLIGKGRTSLAEILLKSSGTMGPLWLTMFSPLDLDSGYGGCKLNKTGKKRPDDLYLLEKRKAVGAVEIKVGFHEKSVRTNILQLAMDIGYAVPWTSRIETEDLVWQTTDVRGFSFKVVTVTVEEVELSTKLINCVFTAEVGFKKSAMKIVTRYRLYKQAIASSPYFVLNEEELLERMFIPVNHREEYCYRVSSDVLRYFRESKLEVQVWAIYGSCARTFDSDSESPESAHDVRLLGSAFFDLSTLILPTDSAHKTVSHILPLWKRGVSNCDSSNVTVTVDMYGTMSALPSYCSDHEDMDYGVRANDYRGKEAVIKGVGRNDEDYLQKSFPAHISIERAVNLKRDSKDTDLCGRNISYFVTFSCYEDKKTIESNINKGVKEVTWNFECDTRLSYSLLTGKDNTLQLRLYYSTSESELDEEVYDQKVLVGLVKLDLSLLLKGFERVIGWYNIEDMKGDCQGQIKVGVTPLVPLVTKSASVNFVQHSSLSKEVKPLTLEDHQTYLANVRMRLHGSVNPAPTYSSTIPYTSVVESSSPERDGCDSLSKSCLYSSLKEKLKELDDINETFRRRISRDENVETYDHNKNSASAEVSLPVQHNVARNEDFMTCPRQEQGTKHSGSEMKESYVNDFEEETVESGSEAYDQLEEKENVSKMIFLNDRDSLHDLNDDHCGQDDFRDSLSFEDNFENTKNRSNMSESECSLVLEDIGDRNSALSGSCNSYFSDGKYSEEEEGGAINTNKDNLPQGVTLNKELNDSWETEDFRKVNNSRNPNEVLNPQTFLKRNHSCETEAFSQVNNSQNPNEILTPQTFLKRNNSGETEAFSQVNNSQNVNETLASQTTSKRSVIPRFFPPSVNFENKMKALKKNIANNSAESRTGQSSVNNSDNNAMTKKKVELRDINDVETRRLSRIFGINKM